MSARPVACHPQPTPPRRAWSSRDRLAHWLEASSTWALGALLATLPFWRHRVLLHRPPEAVFFELHDVTLYTNDLFWWGALGAWLLSRLVAHSPARLRTGPWFVFGPLLGLSALGLAGIPLAVDPLYAAYQAARLVLLLALYLMLVNLRAGQGAIAWPLAAGMAVQAVVAVPQFVLGRTLGLRRLGEVAVNAAWSGSSVVKVGQESWLRAYGFAQHPNLLAGCLMVMLLIVAGYYLAQRGRNRWLLLAALGAGCVALLLTFSRAAWLGTLLGGTVALALLRRERRAPALSPAPATVRLLGVVMLVVSVAFLVLNGPLVRSRLGVAAEPTEVQSVEMRKMQIPAALAMLRMRPLLGVGLGNYAMALYTLAPEMVAADGIYQPVFSVGLLVAAELGVLGGVLWLLLLVAPWPALWRFRAGPMTPWWAGLSAALLALAVASFFDFYPWASHQGRLALWIVLGLWAREWEGAVEARAGQPPPRV